MSGRQSAGCGGTSRQVPNRRSGFLPWEDTLVAVRDLVGVGGRVPLAEGARDAGAPVAEAIAGLDEDGRAGGERRGRWEIRGLWFCCWGVEGRDAGGERLGAIVDGVGRLGIRESCASS